MVILDGELVKGTRVRDGELYLLRLRSRDRRGSGSASRCSASRPRSQTQLKPGVLLGGEASYLRKYEGVDLNTPAGQAVAFGRNFFAVSKSLAIPRAAWSVRVAGTPPRFQAHSTSPNSLASRRCLASNMISE